MNFAAWAAGLEALVHEHQAWAAPICFVLAFAESLAFVSLVVPSSVMLIGIGGLVGYTDLSFIEVFLASAVGAGCGDWLSYWLGEMFEDRIGDLWPFSRHPGWLARARSFIERWGWSGVFLGRFLGPLRASVPIVAGICGMPRWRFQLANWSSAFVWAFALLAPGAFGLAWLRGMWG